MDGWFGSHRVVYAAALVVLGSGMVVAQGSPAAVQGEVSFSRDIRPIVKNFCVTCHAGEDPEAEVSLITYDQVRQHIENGSLLERIDDDEDPMPPSGRMPGYMRRMFRTWSETGFIDKGSSQSEANQKMLEFEEFTPPAIEPVDVESKGFDLLEKMQGHWVGSMNLMGQDFDWMAFDFRAIGASHVHGMFEGGTIGNLFTSFFVTNFNGKRTIMARNGGILNGIYRTSYFVLDKVEDRKDRRGRPQSYYRLVDAYGGKDIMWMELTFQEDRLQFNAYTSRFGLTAPPTPHMQFTGRRKHPELAEAAAKELGFPRNVVDRDFSKGLPKPDWGDEDLPYTSASYMWEEEGMSLVELGKQARDPYRIDQMPHLAKLTVEVERNELIRDRKLQIFLSQKALTDTQGKFITDQGYLRTDLADTILMFPEIVGSVDEFNFTYLHPGEYFLTVVADVNEDGYPSPGDITHAQKRIVVKPQSDGRVKVENIRIRN